MAGATAVAPAHAADVVSANVVGYNKVDLTAATATSVGYTLVGVSFQQVGGEPLDLNTFLGDTFNASLVGGYGVSDSDTIMTWTGTGYTYYYFSADDWSDEAGDGAVDAYKNNKWLTVRDELADISLAPGDAVWFSRAKGEGQLQGACMAGEVPSTNRVVTIPANGYALLASTTPAPLQLNDCGIDWAAIGTCGGYGTSDSDTIIVWTGTGYTYYYFSADDWSDEAGDGAVDAPKNNKWLTVRDELVSTPINLCSGFWFKRNGATSISFTLP